ncbi:MAG: hypothetical protein IJQ07_05800 [Clostridia bacterium]|nr:hypothetical protein [Clostridia bacterium]
MFQLLKKSVISCLFLWLMCFAFACSSENVTNIELQNNISVFEYGFNTSVPVAVAVDEEGKGISYDAVCYEIIDPDGDFVEIKSDSFIPLKVGNFTLSYRYKNLTKDFVIECRDTIKPTIKADVKEEYDVAASYENYINGEYMVHETPSYKASDVSGVFAANTSLKVFLNEEEVPINQENSTFTLNASGKIRFEISATDRNGLTETVNYEAEATVPENFPPYCLSSFASKKYQKLVGGGWLGSSFSSSILDSYTDKDGDTYDGVLKISYPASNSEAGLAITLGRSVKVSEIDYVAITVCAENLSYESSGSHNMIFYKKAPFWENANLGINLEENKWTTIKLPASLLAKFTDLDSETLSGFAIETLDNKKIGRTIYLADISFGYNPENWNIQSLNGDNNSIGIVSNADLSEIGDTQIVVTGKVKKNGENTAVLLDIVDGNFVLSGFGTANVGDELSIGKGFGFKVGRKAYETVGDYIFRFDGTKWDFCVIINAVGLLDNPKGVRMKDYCIYINFDYNLYNGSNKWATLTQNKLLAINGNNLAAPTVQICEWNRDLYFNFGGYEVQDGDIFTIKKGFEITYKGVYYRVDKDISFSYAVVAGGWIIGTPVHIEFEDVEIKRNGSANNVIANAIYVHESANILRTTKSSAWSTLGYSGKIYFIHEGDKQEKALTLQICSWPNDLYFAGFGVAQVGDKIIFEKGFAIIVKGSAFITDKTYEYTFTEEGWTLTESYVE